MRLRQGWQLPLATAVGATHTFVVDPIATLRRWSPEDAPRNRCDGTGLKCFPENVIATVAFTLSVAPISCGPRYVLLVVAAWVVVAVVDAAISCARTAGTPSSLAPHTPLKEASLPCSFGRTEGRVLPIGGCSW